MTTNAFRRWRAFPVAAAFLLAACGGGGGDGGYDCSGTGTVAVSGTAGYEFVPAAQTFSGAKLDYANAEPRPIRHAEIQAVCPDGSSVYDSATTSAAGAYSLDVPENVDVAIRVRAILVRSGAPSWDVRVVDNTAGQAPWSAQGEAFSSGTGSVTVDLQASSGWTGSGYGATRAAAPFAILDSVYTAMEKVLAAEPDAVFPALKLNWSPDNTASCNGNTFPFANGCIGTSFFANYGGSAGRNIFILGKANADTDEYDNHVIIHEWGHYYEDAFARSDSIGGSHSGGDALDPRVAFGEGWGNAFSGIATDDPAYVDTSGSEQSSGFVINVEDDRDGHADEDPNPGWWNETTVQEIIYDLYDAANDDAAALGFAPIHAVLTNEQKTTHAITSIFPLIHFLKVNTTSDADIDEVVAAHDIATITNEWGDGRGTGGILLGNGDDGSEFAAAESVSPVHVDLATVTDGSAANVCSTNQLDSTSEHNRLGARRFLRFQVAGSGSWTITVDGSGNVQASDPDFIVSNQGVNIAIAEDTGAIEDGTVTLDAGDTYLLEIYDWANVDDVANTGGDACFDITFAN